MVKNRFDVIQESKFDKLSNNDLQKIKGGLCLRCRKRARKPITLEIILGTGPKPSTPIGEVNL